MSTLAIALRTGIILLFTIGLLSPVSAELNSPSCEELRQWGQALNTGRGVDSGPIAPLGSQAMASLHYVMFDERTKSLFGKSVYEWTSEEMKAAFLDQNRLERECGRGISSWTIPIRSQISELIRYSERRNAAQRAISESLLELEEEATFSIHLLRLYDALARLPADVEAFKTNADLAWEARRTGTKSDVSGTPRREDVVAYRDVQESLKGWRDANGGRAGRRVLDSLQWLAPPDFQQKFGDIGKRVPVVQQGTRMVFEHELKGIETSFSGFQAFERKVMSFYADIAPWLDDSNREKAQISVENKREEIAANIAADLSSQLDGIREDLGGWQSLERLAREIQTRFGPAIGAARLNMLLAKTEVQKSRIRDTVRNDLVGKVNAAPLTPDGKRILDRIEAELRGQVRAVIDEQGSREVHAAIAHKRSQISVLEEEAKREEFRVSKTIFDEFNRVNRVEIWPENALLHSNPFMFEGKVVGLVVSFELMLARESAIFNTGRSRSLLVSAMPTDWGVGPEKPLMLAMRVTGNQMLELGGVSGLITSAEYVGARACSERNCAEAFRWTEAADIPGVFEEPAVEASAGEVGDVADQVLRQGVEDSVTKTDPSGHESEPVDRLQSFPPELMPIVSRGELTVRAMRAFGLLRRNEEEFVVSLRARGLDLLGAGYQDIQALILSGVAEDIVLSVQDKESLNGLLRRMESLRAAAAIGG